MIVTGEGGTGKGWLIQQTIQDIRVVFGRTDALKRVLLTAHQGSAAFLIGGRTLTTALGLPSLAGSSFRSPYVPLASTVGGQATLRRLQAECELVHLVVVDEFSVISSGMVFWIDQRLREIFSCFQHLPFGGRDIVFTGDPGQLGPVNPSSLSTPVSLLRGESERQGRLLWERISLYFVLREQHRGAADPDWYNALRHVREGNVDGSDLRLINSRVSKPPPTILNSKSLVYIAYRNVDVDAANESALQSLNHTICTIDALHQVQLRNAPSADHDLNPATHHELIEEAKTMTSSSAMYLPVRLNLCIGTPVLLTFNLEQRLGLCNGSRGYVYDIIPDDMTPHHLPIVLVQVTDYRGPSFLDNVSGFVPITSRVMPLTSKRDGPYRVTRIALPLRLGFATTIHKVQGKTCDHVVFNPVSLRGCALAYVALSRVRQRNDIFISSPLSRSQLSKSDQARSIDEAESARVSTLEIQSDTICSLRINRMKTLATMHNLGIAIPEQLWLP